MQTKTYTGAGSTTAYTDCKSYASTILLNSYGNLPKRDSESYWIMGDKYIYYTPIGDRIYKEERSNVAIFYPESNTIQWHYRGLDFTCNAEGLITENN
jgi:hypothetical protein